MDEALVIHHGDCLDVMPTLDAESVDAIVTDPPYGLEFMGKAWDKIRPTHGNWNDAKWAGKGLTQKQGAATDGRNTGVHSLAGATPSFSSGINRRCVTCGKWQSGGSPCLCENPSWERRGDYRAQAMQAWHGAWAEAAYRVAKPSAYLLAFGGTRTHHRLASAIEDAGWIIRDCLVWAYASGFPKSKANLKPAWEPIVMARKPGPLRMLNIDGCRMPANGEPVIVRATQQPADLGSLSQGPRPIGEIASASPLGRWPANVILTDPIFDGDADGIVGGGEARSAGDYPAADGWSGEGYGGRFSQGRLYGDSGTYSRFFLIPKADRADREPLVGGTLGTTTVRLGVERLHADPTAPNGRRSDHPRENVHPTVKPTDLMRHLVRLVTPPGGLVLDPFLGSGTTAIAAEMEGFRWIGIEREAEYVAIAEARLNGTQRGLGLPA